MLIALWFAFVVFVAEGNAYEVRAIPTPTDRTISVARQAVMYP